MERGIRVVGPDVFGWGGGLPREGVGAKKFGRSPETKEGPNFLAGLDGRNRAIQIENR